MDCSRSRLILLLGMMNTVLNPFPLNPFLRLWNYHKHLLLCVEKCFEFISRLLASNETPDHRPITCLLVRCGRGWGAGDLLSIAVTVKFWGAAVRPSSTMASLGVSSPRRVLHLLLLVLMAAVSASQSFNFVSERINGKRECFVRVVTECLVVLSSVGRDLGWMEVIKDRLYSLIFFCLYKAMFFV